MASTIQLVRFRVADFEFALDVMQVQEVMRPVRVDRVPGQSASVAGVVSIRATDLPLVDLRRRLGSRSVEEGRFVIARTPGGKFALHVDSVAEVQIIDSKLLRTGPVAAVDKDALRVKASFRDDDGKLVLLIDLDALLSDVLSGSD